MLVAPAVVLAFTISKQERLLCFVFHSNPEMTFGMGAVAFGFYFEVPHKIRTKMHALVLLSVGACHQVPQTNCRHASALPRVRCFLKNGF